MLKRPRRNRRTSAIRSLTEETFLRAADLVAPFFIVEGQNRREPIAGFAQIERLSLDLVMQEAKRLHQQGVLGIILFPVIPTEKKDEIASAALDPEGVIPQAVRALKREIPTLCVITDIALDPFTSHGHDGLVRHEEILNDETLEVLQKMALIHAASGADFVAPSDMMDGRVGALRRALDAQGLMHTGILSYTSKYASSLYAPFREALGSSLRFGDKKTYQMNPANSREALLEARLDEEEGADILMVKPALFYLDIIHRMKQASHLPICAFHVSGEYAMVMAAHERGMLNAEKVFYEALLSIKRAGADFIISYATPLILTLLSRTS